MFEGLNTIPWADHRHAYGSAEEVPMWLRQLASDDELVRRKAHNHLGGSICHEGFLCDATAYTVPYLIELLQEPTVQKKDEILDLLTWIAQADPIEELLRWQKSARRSRPTPPEPVPLKDAHAAVGAGVSTYITLLGEPELHVRIQAASLLVRFPEWARELWPALLAAFEREDTEQGRMNLAFALSSIGRRLPEQRAFFVEPFQAHQNELTVFAAALALAWLAKTETPEEVIQLLTHVAIEAPTSLEAYREFPCGGRGVPAWSAALNALCNLGSSRLQFLAPLLEERLASPRREHAYYLQRWAMLLLFIVFGEETDEDARPPLEEALTQYQQQDTHWLLSYIILGKNMETSHPPRPVTALTERQRETLLLLLHQGVVSTDVGRLLEAYGLPDVHQELAAYLGQELPSPVIRQAPRGQPAGPPRQDRLTRYKETIQAAYPDLRIRRTQGHISDEASQEDYVFLVNDELIFRFPTQEASVEKLEQEVALLRALQGRLPLPIMAPAYASQSVREVGRVFVGYVKPPGKPLYKEMLESVDGEETVQRLAEELAAFLSALHHLPIAEFVPLSLKDATSRAALEALYARTRENLFPQMSAEKQAQITTHFEVFLDTPEHVAVSPTLVHGSFFPEAIIYRAKIRRISSITGFSRAGLGDPARDIGGLLGPRGYGEAFVRRFVPIYPEVVTLLERARFYAEVHALEEGLRRLAAGSRTVVNQTTFYP